MDLLLWIVSRKKRLQKDVTTLLGSLLTRRINQNGARWILIQLHTRAKMLSDLLQLIFTCFTNSACAVTFVFSKFIYPINQTVVSENTFSFYIKQRESSILKPSKNAFIASRSETLLMWRAPDLWMVSVWTILHWLGNSCYILQNITMVYLLIITVIIIRFRG